METLDSLRRRINSAQDLHGIVRTMKALSAASIRQFERAVEAVEAYSSTIESGLHILLKEQDANGGDFIPREQGGIAAVIFGSDQGMCGQFNEQIVTFARQSLEAEQTGPGDLTLLVIGLRAASRMQEQNQPFQEVYPVPGSVQGINPAVQSLLLKINQWREEGRARKVLLFYNRPLSSATYEQVRYQLMPFDRGAFQEPQYAHGSSRSIPTYTMNQGQLLSALVRQYFFVQLFRAYAESLASENASRLMTMQAAEKNIEDRLGELNGQYHGQRQNAITSELLDIVSGFEVLSR
jgi:F-type H+-transporting ATPase subunit gamma